MNTNEIYHLTVKISKAWNSISEVLAILNIHPIYKTSGNTVGGGNSQNGLSVKCED